MAFDAFLKIDGIPGESTDDRHKDWLEVIAFGHHMEQPASATASSAGGATAERVNHSTFDVVHLLDKSSPKLAEACCTGRHLKEVVLELCRAGGDKLTYAVIRLEQVVIARIQSNGSTGHSAGFPTETVSFSYGRITWKYVVQRRADGQSGGSVVGGWDLTTNRVIA